MHILCFLVFVFLYSATPSCNAQSAFGATAQPAASNVKPLKATDAKSETAPVRHTHTIIRPATSVDHASWWILEFMLGKWVYEDANRKIEEFWSEEPDRSRLFCIRTIHEKGQNLIHEIYKFRDNNWGGGVDGVRLDAVLGSMGTNWIGGVELREINSADLNLQKYNQAVGNLRTKEFQSYKQISGDTVRFIRESEDGTPLEDFNLTKVKDSV